MADKIMNGRSSQNDKPAVKGEFTGTGPIYIHDGGKGVHGHSQNGYGVYGTSDVGRGVVAMSDTNYGIRAVSWTLAAARCTSTDGTGVEGEAKASGNGVTGVSKTGMGIYGFSETAYGVKGESSTGRGVAAFSDTNYGLRATSRTLSAARCSSTEGSGVEGEAGSNGDGVRGTSVSGSGLKGLSQSGQGITGFSNTAQGIYGHSVAQAGVVGESDQFDGLYGISHSSQHAGISGHNPGGMAGFFEGDVVVTGDVKLTGGNDIAENLLVAPTNKAAVGFVMTFNEDGSMQACSKAYDKKVVGVISGAGDYKPGLILGQDEKEGGCMPIALMGKVFCWTDADFGAVEVGDMLTSSSTAGHAMKAMDPSQAFGAIIGKALKPLKAGKGLIPVLVSLQ